MTTELAGFMHDCITQYKEWAEGTDGAPPVFYMRDAVEGSKPILIPFITEIDKSRWGDVFRQGTAKANATMAVFVSEAFEAAFDKDGPEARAFDAGERNLPLPSSLPPEKRRDIIIAWGEDRTGTLLIDRYVLVSGEGEPRRFERPAADDSAFAKSEGATYEMAHGSFFGPVEHHWGIFVDVEEVKEYLDGRG